jgi:hypothetical protein
MPGASWGKPVNVGGVIFFGVRVQAGDGVFCGPRESVYWIEII